MSTNYLKQIKKEINYLRAHEENDLEWYDEGIILLENNKLDEAEKKFKELIMSQPNAQDGYEGLALTYEKLDRKDKALYFIKEALNKAKQFLDQDTIDELYGPTFRRIQQMR